MEPKISAPLDSDITRLAQQRMFVETLAVEHLSGGLPGDDGDLDVLQRILDRDILAPDDTYELQSLGIVFGMRLVDAIEGLDWAIVQDEFGRDPALRYLDTSLLIFPLTMISKRVEDGVHVDIREMFEGVRSHVASLKGQVSRPN
jgi:hypothetical protein